MILAEHEAKDLLQGAEIAVVPVRITTTFEEARAAAQAMGYPLALKLSTSRHSHKTDIGGVLLNIQDEAELQRAFSRLSQLRDQLDPQAVIITEPMAASGAEFFIGVQRHQYFGPVISLGLGGVLLELLKDVSFRLLPATREDFREMLAELKCWPQLRKGFRHLPPVNEEPLLDLMQDVAALALERTELEEMDLNPVIAYSDRTTVVDARIVLA